MKKITFTKLVIKNFLSIGEEPVEIDFKKGLHILTGDNRDKPDRQNAVGKSTIADALYFSIFGETLRGIKKDLITNNITGGKSQVELFFSVNSPKGNNKFHIIRTLTPTKVSIYKDEVDKTRDSISNTTKYICDVLSASPAIFQNCVIMTVNNTVPFMAKNKIEKRKFIEDIFGMEVFSKMMSTLRLEYNDIKRDYDINNAKLNEINSNINSYNEQRLKILEKKTEKYNLYTNRQLANETELNKLNSELIQEKNMPSINDIQKIIDDMEKKLVEADKIYTIFIQEGSNKKANLIHKKEIFKKIGTEEDICPICLRTMEDHDKIFISDEKNKLKLELMDMAREIEAVGKRIKDIQGFKLTIQQNIQQNNRLINETSLSVQHNNNIKTRILQLKQWQDELTKDLQALSNTYTEFDDIIESTNKKHNDLSEYISSIFKKISILDTVKFVISEEGVKSYIVNKLLELLNSRLFYYLKLLDSNSVCVFDEYFEEQIVNDNNKLCSYFNFSGAERKAIDLACLFAFSDMRRMQGGVSYNIAIYDELFDSSFDEKGIDLITNILKSRVEALQECSIVISHRKESIKEVTGDIIYLVKEKGITKRVDYLYN